MDPGAVPVTLETLRLAVGLAHAVPGVHLRLGCPAGERIVAPDPHGDVTPCEMRRVVLASGHPGRDCSRHIDHLAVTGGVRRSDGGVLRRDGSTPEAWFATLLRPEGVATVVDERGDGPLDDQVVIRLRPDPGLGVTCVGVVAEPAAGVGGGRAVEAVGAELWAACLVAEVIVGSRRTSGRAP